MTRCMTVQDSYRWGGLPVAFAFFACLLVARVLYVLWIEEITYGWISVMVDVVVQSAYGVHSYKLFIYLDNNFFGTII